MANVSDELLQLRKRARRRLVGAIALVVFALTVLWTALDGEPPKSLLENQTVEIISSAPALSSVVSLTPAVPVEPVVASAVNEVAKPQAASVPVAAVAPVAEVVDASRVAPVALPGKLVSHQETAPKAVADSTQVAAPTTAPTQRAAVKATAKPSPRPSPKPSIKSAAEATVKPASAKVADPKAILEGGLEQSAEKLYYIQIGAYADAEKAAQTLKKLKDAGIPARSEKVSTPKGELTRVRIGPGNDEAKAKAWLKRLDSLGVPGTLVVKAAP